MVTQKAMISVTAALLLILSLSTWAANPIASIDRSRITLDDMLTLTIRVNGIDIFDSPDTAPLQKDFEVLSTRQSSRHSIINGKTESVTEWQISLLPKSAGNLRIPPLEVGDKTTEPLTVFVEASRDYDAASGDPVFLESEISADTVYVQQQLLFTVRVFQSIQLDNLSLSDIEIEDALIEKLSQNSFQRRINNRLYRIHEIRYALFPQKSGPLTIPEVIFRANKIVNQRSIFSLPGQGQPIRKMTRQHEITVLDPPPAFSRLPGATWLPAADIALEETWSGDLDKVRVGDSITRTITLKARGLLGAQLPPHEFKEIEGARFYPDQGKLENSLAEQGVSSVRIDSTAIIPTREGRLAFPAITVRWWDTNKNKMRSATIAAHSVNVKAAPAGSIGNSQPLAVDHTQDKALAGLTAAQQSAGNGPWPWVASIFASLWLITLWMWWRSRRAPSVRALQDSRQQSSSDEKRLFNELMNRCQSGDHRAIRAALINWGQSLWPQTPIHTLGDISLRANTPELTRVLEQLDRTLYADTEHVPALSTEDLIARLQTLRNRQRQRSKGGSDSQLPALYPDGGRRFSAGS